VAEESIWLSIPYVWNAMRRNAYEFMRRFIHFADNSLDEPIGSPGYDPLFKVRYALDAIQEGLLKVWSAGKDIAINESMIKYMGRAIAWVQYMPAKPIKHGIKVLCVCCAVSGIMLAYKVYCGKGDKKMGGTVISLCDNLLQKAGLTDAQGRTLYTNNYYTSLSLVKHLHNKYRWTCVGTIVPTEKNERASHDLPFHKLSNGARNMTERGWYCKAAIKLRAENSRHDYYIQCSTWKDKKQVMFLSNNRIGRSVGLTVNRRVRDKKHPDTIPAPRAQADYVQNFNTVDRNDRDSADYLTTICTNRYYVRIFCWALDRVIHAAYVIVCNLSQAGMGSPRWKQ
jgi:hypothetical protein